MPVSLAGKMAWGATKGVSKAGWWATKKGAQAAWWAAKQPVKAGYNFATSRRLLDYDFVGNPMKPGPMRVTRAGYAMRRAASGTMDWLSHRKPVTAGLFGSTWQYGPTRLGRMGSWAVNKALPPGPQLAGMVGGGIAGGVVSDWDPAGVAVGAIGGRFMAGSKGVGSFVRRGAVTGVGVAGASGAIGIYRDESDPTRARMEEWGGYDALQPGISPVGRHRNYSNLNATGDLALGMHQMRHGGYI